MDKSFKNIFATSALALAVMASTHAAYGDAAQEVIEARQEAQIWTTYALSPYLRASEIKVEVNDGKAILTGKVDEDVNKDLAKQIALGVSGIKSVDNNIVVESNYAPEKSADNYGDMIDDATVTAGVKSRLAWSKHMYNETNTVKTKNGRVTLAGSVDSKEAKDFAGRLTMGTRGVVSVDNKLVVDEKLAAKAKSNGKAGEAADKKDSRNDIEDGWITTKVKSYYMYSSNVKSSDIDVKTTNGVVTLKGKVDSGAERALAIELAQNIRGVKSVEASGLKF
jgi:hyperosmotically inducible periplasmic protein